MVFGDFILENIEQILQEWEDFARSLEAGERLDREGLRDHADSVLRALARDLLTRSSRVPPCGKLQERGSGGSGESPAERHGEQRAVQGFDINEMFLEFQSLRASVINAWRKAPHSAGPDALTELTQFNEAMDHALGESIRRFTTRTDQARELFLAVVGHDLRTPLGAIMSSADYLMQSEGLAPEQTKAVSRILRSGTRAQKMIGDVLDMTRHRLEGSLPIKTAQLDVGLLCQRVVDESAAYHPGCVLRCEAGGKLSATWDAGRITQLLSNLVENAVRHGADDAPVIVAAAQDGDFIVLAVHNEGPVIPEAHFQTIFDPLTRGVHQPKEAHRLDSIGLGLYIVRAVAQAHGGDVTVASSKETGTTFTVRLPQFRKH